MVTSPRQRLPFLFAIALSAVLVAGCSGGGGVSDLQRYVETIKAKPGGRIAPMPEFKTYESFDYTVKDKRDPFTPFDTTMAKEEPKTNNGIRPDLDRHKEALEQFPLDTLKFAGNIEKGGENWAIITAPDGLVYRVQTGNHIGQNYGRIVGISDSQIQIIEIVPDGLGGWIQRPAALSIDENG